MKETYNLRSRTLAPPTSDIEGHRPAVAKELIAESARPTLLGKGGEVESEIDVGVSLRPRAGGKYNVTTDLSSTEANPTTDTTDTVITDRSPISDGSSTLRPSGTATCLHCSYCRTLGRRCSCRRTTTTNSNRCFIFFSSPSFNSSLIFLTRYWIL